MLGGEGLKVHGGTLLSYIKLGKDLQWQIVIFYLIPFRNYTCKLVEFRRIKLTNKLVTQILWFITLSLGALTTRCFCLCELQTN